MKHVAFFAGTKDIKYNRADANNINYKLVGFNTKNND